MRTIVIAGAALLLSGALPTTMGGWAVITVRELPAHIEAGRVTTIEFTVRQHGQALMNDLSPRVVARRKGAGWFSSPARVRARSNGQEGGYVAQFTLADTGEVAVTIDANWHSAETTLLPIRVVAPGHTPGPQAPAAIGQQLFVAKGCVTCHLKADDRDLRGRLTVRVGPDLTGTRLTAAYVAGKLANPALNRVRTSEYFEMPDLGLVPAEIGALVSYLTEGTVQAARR